MKEVHGDPLGKFLSPSQLAALLLYKLDCKTFAMSSWGYRSQWYHRVQHHVAPGMKQRSLYGLPSVSMETPSCTVC